MTTAAAPLTASDPWARRIGAWFDERFPAAMVVVGLPTFLAANLVGQVAGRDPSTPPTVRLDLRLIGGWLAAVGFLLCIRIFDEHKDHDDDVRLHPDRLLSRGVVRLRELDAIQVVVLAGIVAVCWWFDRGCGAAFATFGIAFGWLLLMRVEFFVGRWLRPRIVLYAVSHAVVTPLAAWWMFTTGAGRIAAPRILVPFLVAAYCSSLLFELARKLLPPADEREGVATYSSALGPDRAARLTAALVMAHALAVTLELAWLPGARSAIEPWLWAHLLGLVALAATLALGAFARRPDAETHRPLEALVGLNLLVPAVAIVTVVLVRADVAWGWA